MPYINSLYRRQYQPILMILNTRPNRVSFLLDSASFFSDTSCGLKYSSLIDLLQLAKYLHDIQYSTTAAPISSDVILSILSDKDI